MVRIVSWLLAVLVHVVIAVVLMLQPKPVQGVPPPPPPGGGDGDSEVLRIRFYSERMGLEEQRKGEREGAIHEEPCDGRYYIGIGIVSFGGVVAQVARGGPADRAGIVIGETIANEDILGRDRYPVGTELMLVVQGRGLARALMLRVDRICEE